MTLLAALPPLTTASALTTWTLDPLAVGLAVVLAVGQVALVLRVRRRGHRWPWWRVAVSVVLGPVLLALVSCSFTGVYGRVAFWPVALAATLLLVVVPAGIALGDPVRLVRLASPVSSTSGPRPRHLGRAAARVLDAPVVGALAGVAVQLAYYLTPWMTASLRSGAVRSLTGVVLVGVGALFAVPAFGSAAAQGTAADGEAGAWGLRVLLASVDGLLDAVPGLVVGVGGVALAGGWYAHHHLAGALSPADDQLLGGTLAVAVAEVVAAPLLLSACVRWSRADAAQAAREDAALDAAERLQRRG
ncbi:cytochrome c oxidase assembly protein [Quadrisphaera sp. INWT6]|uniref:cytochrome c oxidase assembly protein n=1 Tax=Quadrisphaera sp. INWT6 TaxID=2596917 RepID=UPI00189254B6|nr:cytochrome c oxidase assembly protein [Quadrisphaera sp. INWT6]